MNEDSMWVKKENGKPLDKDKDEDDFPLDEEGFPLPKAVKEGFEAENSERVDMDTVEASIAIQKGGVKIAKERTRNEIREMFLMIFSAITMKAHCRACLEADIESMIGLVRDLPIDATLSEQKAHDIPHGEDNDGKDD